MSIDEPQIDRLSAKLRRSAAELRGLAARLQDANERDTLLRIAKEFERDVEDMARVLSPPGANSASR